MEYLEFKPHKDLARYVECYWYAYSNRPPFREKESLIPDGTIELMFNFGEDYAQLRDGQRQMVKGSHLIGIRKHSLLISQTGKQHFFCIRFKPGGTYPFFKIPVHLFANAFYSLEDLFGNVLKEMEEKLYHAKNNALRVATTNEYLLKKLDTANYDYAFFGYCFPLLLRHSDIGAVAKSLRTGYKTLERKFEKVTGLSPSELLKISRFNRAVLAMYSCRFNNFTGIAHACGYYDQSHFIREFKQLTDFTPREFLKERFTIVEVIQPALAERMSKLYNFE